jgi:hypothetical protein
VRVGGRSSGSGSAAQVPQSAAFDDVPLDGAGLGTNRESVAVGVRDLVRVEVAEALDLALAVERWRPRFDSWVRVTAISRRKNT